MYGGEIVETGSAETGFASSRMCYTLRRRQLSSDCGVSVRSAVAWKEIEAEHDGDDRQFRGQAAIHGASVRNCRAMSSMLPQDGAGGAGQEPKKASLSSARTATAIVMVT